MSDSLVDGLLLLAGGLITGAVTYLTARNSNKTQRDSVLAQVEQGAAERAAGVYKGAIDQLTTENRDLRAKVADLERRFERCRLACSRLARRIDPQLDVDDDGLPDVGPNGTLH